MRALLPVVVFDDAFVAGSKSHGEREAELPTTRSQSAGMVLCFQQRFSRVSVLGLFHGSCVSGASGGLAMNARQRAVNGWGGAEASSPIVPVQASGATGAVPSSKSHTTTV